LACWGGEQDAIQAVEPGAALVLHEAEVPDATPCAAPEQGEIQSLVPERVEIPDAALAQDEILS